MASSVSGFLVFGHVFSALVVAFIVFICGGCRLKIFLYYEDLVHVRVGPLVVGLDISLCGLLVCSCIDGYHDIKL